MKLLLALDFFNTSQALQLLDQLAESIDIVEIGTPFIIHEGINAIREVKKNFPHLSIMADLKIMDAGKYESRLAFNAGADIVTVLGVAHPSTIQASIKVAKELSKKIMLDMIGIDNMENKLHLIDTLGIDYICAHTAVDNHFKKNDFLHDLKTIKANIKYAKTAIAGGINLSNIAKVIQEKPDIIIIGSGITGQSDPQKTVIDLKKIMSI